MAPSPRQVGDQMGGAMAELGRAFDRATREARKEAAAVARAEHRAAAKVVAGPDQQFSNWGRKAKLGVKVRSTDQGIDVGPVGPWGIGEVGADPHKIRPRQKRLKIDGKVRSGAVDHPGTRAKQGRKAWTRAEEATVKALDRQIPATLDREIDRHAP